MEAGSPAEARVSLPAHLTREHVEDVAREFTRVFHDLKDQTFATTTWLQVPLVKTPADIVVFQQIIAETRPELIVETGVYVGGSALLFASIQELMGIDGKVIAVDVDLGVTHQRVKDHPRIELIEGSSTDPEIVEHIRREAQGRRVMVDLDADHRAEHVREELRLYADLVSPGCYLTVEDGFFGGRPVRPDAIPGPSEALESFLADDPPFAPDRWRERYLLTQNPRGYLLRDGELDGGPPRREPPAGFVTGSLELTPGSGTGEAAMDRTDGEVEALRSSLAGGMATGADPARAARRDPGAEQDPAAGAYAASVDNLLAEIAAQRDLLRERTRLLNDHRTRLRRITTSKPYRLYKKLRGLPGISQLADRRARRRMNHNQARRTQRAKTRRERTERFSEHHRGQ